MYIVRMQRLGGLEKDYEFHDKEIAQTFYEGIKSIMDAANIVTLELIAR